MQLSLKNVLPIPLKDRLEDRPSDIWMKEISWGQHEQIFIQAPSGTGKTTLIHLLYCLRNDHDGTVSWGDRQVTDREAVALLRTQDVSVIFQDLRLFPELTAWENLEIKRTLTNTVTAAEMASWMERLGVTRKRDSMGKTLSYGEQQRFAIIRALLQPFKWLLMDEPFSHLDKNNTRKAAALIADVVQQRGASFLLADLDENDYFTYTKTYQL
jgi:ABC-type lipoprotein export system ATPase subunit